MERAYQFPFGLESNIELFELYGIDLPSLVNSLPSTDIKPKLSNLLSLGDFDIDENYIHSVNCHYFNVSEISELKVTIQDLSLFHINSMSLTLHFDQLHSLISNLKIPFDLIGITENRQQKDTNSLTNVNINGYNLYAQPSKSHAGSAAIYKKSDIDYKVRDELNALEDDFKSMWVNVNTSATKNMLCGCIYRHPNTNVEKFIKYLDTVFSKAKVERKLVFNMGGLNINLLNYDSITLSLMNS